MATNVELSSRHCNINSFLHLHLKARELGRKSKTVMIVVFDYEGVATRNYVVLDGTVT
jgi:hypothetical protein